MHNIIKLMAEELASNNKVIEFKDNSVFGIYDMPNYTHEDINTVSMKIGNGLVNDLVKIREQYRPIMKDYINIVKTKVSEMGEPDPASRYSIVELKLPMFIQEMKKQGQLPAKRASVEMPMSNLIIDLPIDDIMDLLKLPNTILNSYLQDIVVKYTKDEIKSIVDKYLLNVSNTNETIDMMNVRVNSNSDEVIMMFVIADNLLNNQPSSVRLSTGKYKSIMSVLVSELINTMSILDNNITTGAALKRLVLSIKDEYTIVVNGLLYEEFLKEHSSEVILGMLVNGASGLNDTRMDNIVINKDKYQSAWDRKIKLDIVNASRNKNKSYRIAYELGLKELLKHIPDNLNDVLYTNINTYSDDVIKLLEDTDRSDITNVEKIAREVVGNILFPTTNFYKFTGYMMEYKQDNPSITPEEAATLAGIDMVVDYVLQQVNIKEL